jgi:ATP-dependent phosphofructokinase / diphosphate-dependent phosphofructokinase
MKKVGLIFSGGPAPAANAVISAAALAFLDRGVQVVGFLDGFSHLESVPDALVEGKHYLNLDTKISSIRNQRGIFLRSSRANPGKPIKNPADLKDPEKTAKIRKIKEVFSQMGVEALVTMGGDDTLKTANFLHLLGIPTVHVPKTIDNDYYGIAWTFGFWTAVEAAKQPLLTLKSDADSTNSYFIVELMGRKAGWITYAAGIAAEACAIFAAEDFDGDVDPDALADHLANVMVAREIEGRTAGIICIAEGLADKLPDSLKPKEIDKHGNPYYGTVELCKNLAKKVAEAYKAKTGKDKRINHKQIGYETRTAPPISYDVVLGSMLGYGACCLMLDGKFGHMVSVEANLDLRAVPFSDLVDPKTLYTKVRMVDKERSLFHLKEALSFPLKKV